MATTIELLTAEEYARLPDDGPPTELVEGRVVTMNVPAQLHGYICATIVSLLRTFVESNDLGRVMSNDSAVITRRNPDSVRGADVAYYSFARLPKGPLSPRYIPVIPELVVEVLSPDDRWSDVHAKTAEYLNAGVSIDCLVDPRTESVQLYFLNHPPRLIEKGNEVTFPEVLGDFHIPVAKLFE